MIFIVIFEKLMFNNLLNIEANEIDEFKILIIIEIG